jgi:hypothetical protein
LKQIKAEKQIPDSWQRLPTIRMLRSTYPSRNRIKGQGRSVEILGGLKVACDIHLIPYKLPNCDLYRGYCDGPSSLRMPTFLIYTQPQKTDGTEKRNLKELIGCE